MKLESNLTSATEKRIAKLGLLAVLASALTACISSEPIVNEHQERMLRCEQYIGDMRERCLRGELTNIDDYKEDLKEFQRSQKEEDKSKVKPLKEKIKTENES